MDMDRLDLDRFLNQRNVERYRKLACAATTEAERQTLLVMLTEETVKCFGPKSAQQGHELTAIPDTANVAA